jgi:hypothetical protein
MEALRMLRIYLDQNKWIDLAKAKKCLEDGKPLQDALLVAEEGVQRGLASFPLSSAHYIETSHIPNYARRSELADIMFHLSRHHTIAPQELIVPSEIDAALRRFFGRPQHVRTSRVFGVGVCHAFGQPLTEFKLPDGAPLDEETRSFVENLAKESMEDVSLRGFPEGESKELENNDPNAHRTISCNYARLQERRRQQLRDSGWNRGERSKRVATARALDNYFVPIDDALLRAGLTWDSLFSRGRSFLSQFVEAIPLAYAEAQLERERHAAVNKPWEPNDLIDLDSLSKAIVYCDVVVTERQWVSLATKAGLDKRFNTIMLSSVSELSQHLVRAL